MKNMAAEGCDVVQDSIVATKIGGTGIKMTAQRGGTLMKNVTVEGCGIANKNKCYLYSVSLDPFNQLQQRQ